MSTTMRARVRWTAWVGALLLVVLSLGTGGTAFADPGNGKGHGQGQGNGQGQGSGSEVSSRNGRGDGGVAQSAGGSNQKSSTASGKSRKGSTAPSSNAKSHSTSASSSGGAKADHSQGNAGTSGTWNQKQPNSTADQNTGGANGQCADYEGVYCSTRDGSASKNGNNVGKATGRPCAGCVGKADNKNPQGQKPDAKRDGNNGYECDGNNGIAKGNPAHTRCQPGDNVERCPDGSVVPAGGADDCPKPPEGCPDGEVMVDGECAEVGGEETMVPPLPDIAGVEDFAPRPKPRPAPGAEVLGVQATADAPAVLPATGSSAGMGLLTGVGFLLLAAGSVLAMRRRPA